MPYPPPCRHGDICQCVEWVTFGVHTWTGMYYWYLVSGDHWDHTMFCLTWGSLTVEDFTSKGRRKEGNEWEACGSQKSFLDNSHSSSSPKLSEWSKKNKKNSTQYSLKIPRNYHYAPMNIYSQVQTNDYSQIIWLLEIHLKRMTNGYNVVDRQSEQYLKFH